jgi:hypothetical protein
MRGAPHLTAIAGPEQPVIRRRSLPSSPARLRIEKGWDGSRGQVENGQIKPVEASKARR